MKLENLYKRKTPFKPSPLGMFLSYVIMIFWAFVVLFPLFWLFVTSLKLPIDVNTGPFYIPFLEFQPSGHAWEYILFGDLSNDTIRAYKNTVVVGFSSAILTLVLGHGRRLWLNALSLSTQAGCYLDGHRLYYIGRHRYMGRRSLVLVDSSRRRFVHCPRSNNWPPL